MALKGIKIIEIAGLAPAPFCGLILSDYGANVIRIERPGHPVLDSLRRGKRTASIDLKNEAGKGIFKTLCRNADVLIEPFRPGVMERLGLGPKPMLDLNKRLIYARLSGYGQEGAYSKRAGHDLNYIAMSGVLSGFCSNGRPVPPMNMLADFAGGGMTCAMGILVALIERSKSNLGQVIDVSMVEGTRYVSTYLWHTQKESAAARQFIWPNHGKKEQNLIDGGAHFYTVYKTKDDRWMSVAAIEPQFYSSLLAYLDLDEAEWQQFDFDRWPKYKEALAEIFAQKTLNEWIEVFKDANDTCVEPVLELNEAEAYDKQRLARPSSFNSDHTPRPAPLLSRTPAVPNLDEPDASRQTVQILKEHGYEESEILKLSKERAIECELGLGKL